MTKGKQCNGRSWSASLGHRCSSVSFASADATIEGLDGAERVRVAEHDLVLAAVDSGPVCFRAGLPTATELGRIVVNEAALDNGSDVTMPAEVEPGTGTGCN